MDQAWVPNLDHHHFPHQQSDGFMVLHKMFGDAFAGDALTNKAITNEATRETDEIHQYIAAMTSVDPIG